MATVFSSQEVKIELNTGTISSPDWKILNECTGVAQKGDANVDERDIFGSSWTKRTITGGKKMDFSFEVKLIADDDAHKRLREIAYSDDLIDNNDNQIRLTYPLADASNSNQRTETLTGIIKINEIGPQAATDLTVINFEFMSAQAPIISNES